MSTLQQQAKALGDPTRHRIFGYVRDSPSPVGVAELTDHFGLNHNAIRQHLAQLVEAELVRVSTAPPEGPGRPRLVYDVDPTVEGRWGMSGPYERLSLLLTEIISGGASALEVGRQAGRQQPIGAEDFRAAVAEVEAAVARDGFEPEVVERDGGVDLVLHRCPFQVAAVAVPEVVCALHLGLAEGMVEANEHLEATHLVVEDPRDSPCRLRLGHGPRDRDRTGSPAATPDRSPRDP